MGSIHEFSTLFMRICKSSVFRMRSYYECCVDFRIAPDFAICIKGNIYIVINMVLAHRIDNKIHLPHIAVKHRQRISDLKSQSLPQIIINHAMPIAGISNFPLLVFEGDKVRNRIGRVCDHHVDGFDL